MKKFVGLFIALVIISGIFSAVSACHFKKNSTEKIQINTAASQAEVTLTDKKETKNIELLPTMNSESTSSNRIWVGTFQIVWNEVLDNIVKGPIEFIDRTTQTAKNLNAREFNKTDISEDSYYTTYGIIEPSLKTRIEKALKEKFNETSDILDGIDFSYDSSKMLIYAMLKKDFKFLEPFDKLSDSSFGKNFNKVEYFGIDENSTYKLYKNVDVLFYNSSGDYAVKLHTKSNDEVILYKTKEDKKFNELYAEILNKTENYKGNKIFDSNDRLKVPNINLYQMTSFPEVEGRQIKNTNFRIDATIETVDFKMDNEGVKLKSEAAIMIKCTALPVMPQIRRFYFDDTFVLFLIEKDKNVPYFALRVDDVETINKTGK